VIIQKKPKNGQTILFLANSYKKVQMATLVETVVQFALLTLLKYFDNLSVFVLREERDLRSDVMDLESIL